ncbi:hypothetical protein ACHAW6_009859 [Cyclotella cf. meneghiniana]
MSNLMTMAMVRAIMFHATLLGHSSAAVHRSLSSLSPSTLSFVGTRPLTRWTTRGHSHRIFGAFASGGNLLKRDHRFSSRLAEFPTDHLDRKTEDLACSYRRNDEDFIYDNDANEGDTATENEEAINGLDEPENVPSRSYLLHKALLQAVQSSLNNLSKKTTSLQRELEKAKSLEETMARANLIVSNLYRLPPGTTSIEVEDWENDGKIVELVLNTKGFASAQEESDALFALARKMKRGSKVVEELLNNSLEGEKILKDALVSLHGSQNINQDSNDDIIEGRQLDEDGLIFLQEKLERTSKMTGFKTPSVNELLSQSNHRRQPHAEKSQRTTRYTPNPRELISPSGHKVLVGRNRRDNEAICFQLSRPTDIWMHARGCPGAHVLLCVRRGSPEVTDDDLQFAADLAIFYSDARTERKASVTTAEPKHITKPRGAPPGAVSLRQEGRTLVGRPEMVSDDLKEAREMSGAAWDEMGYRKLGTRARNKKRTAAVEKSTREKKRQEANAKNKRKIRRDENEWF